MADTHTESDSDNLRLFDEYSSGRYLLLGGGGGILSPYLSPVTVHGAGPDADPVEHVGHEVAGVLPRHKHQHQVPGGGETFSKSYLSYIHLGSSVCRPVCHPVILSSCHNYNQTDSGDETEGLKREGLKMER
jgi:hypothetical protein